MLDFSMLDSLVAKATDKVTTVASCRTKADTLAERVQSEFVEAQAAQFPSSVTMFPPKKADLLEKRSKLEIALDMLANKCHKYEAVIAAKVAFIEAAQTELEVANSTIQRAGSVAMSKAYAYLQAGGVKLETYSKVTRQALVEKALGHVPELAAIVAFKVQAIEFRTDLLAWLLKHEKALLKATADLRHLAKEAEALDVSFTYAPLTEKVLGVSPIVKGGYARFNFDTAKVYYTQMIKEAKDNIAAAKAKKGAPAPAPVVEETKVDMLVPNNVFSLADLKELRALKSAFRSGQKHVTAKQIAVAKAAVK